MVEAEEVEEGGVEIVDVDGVFNDVPADLVGFADDLPALDAAAGHEDRKRERMMVATGVGRSAATVFAQRRASELARPNHEG